MLTTTTTELAEYDRPIASGQVACASCGTYRSSVSLCPRCVVRFCPRHVFQHDHREFTTLDLSVSAAAALFDAVLGLNKAEGTA